MNFVKMMTFSALSILFILSHKLAMSQPVDSIQFPHPCAFPLPTAQIPEFTLTGVVENYKINNNKGNKKEAKVNFSVRTKGHVLVIAHLCNQDVEYVGSTIHGILNDEKEMIITILNAVSGDYKLVIRILDTEVREILHTFPVKLV